MSTPPAHISAALKGDGGLARDMPTIPVVLSPDDWATIVACLISRSTVIRDSDRPTEQQEYSDIAHALGTLTDAIPDGPAGGYPAA